MSFFYGEIKYTIDYSEFKCKIKSKRLREFYIRKSLNILIEKVEFLDTYRFIITLPIRENYDQKEVVYKVINKTKDLLKSYNIQMIAVDKTLEKYFEGYDFPKKEYIYPIFTYKILKRCMIDVNKTMDKFNVTLYWENNILCRQFISFLVMEVKNINILFNEPDNFEYYSFLEEIFQETGLNISVYKKNSSIIEESDVIIAFDKVNEISKFKAKCIFIDLGNNKNKIKSRQDIVHINSIELKLKNKYLNDLELDWYLYTTDRSYRNYRKGFGEIDNLLEKLEIKLVTVKSKE